jgi:hypothetical protein
MTPSFFSDLEMQFVTVINSYTNNGYLELAYKSNENDWTLALVVT